MKKDSLLYPYIAIAPPLIILFYLYTKNAEYINYWHTTAAALIFALLSLAFYAAIARIGKPSGGRAALLTVVLWVLSVTLWPLYLIFMLGVLKPVRYGIAILIILSVVAAIFMYGKRIRRKEVFALIAVFESVLLLFNVISATIRFAAGEGGRGASVTIKTADFTVNPAAPSPNIYWLFMDGMLGFKGMETLFDDRQSAFTAELEERGFLINRDAEFEVFHATMRATPALFCPAWYDTVFLPFLETVDLSDYENKRRKIGRFSTTNALENNEFITAFNARGYMTYAVSFGYLYTGFQTSAQKFFFDNGENNSRRESVKLLTQYLQIQNLQGLFTDALAPYAIVARPLSRMVDRMYAFAAKPAGITVSDADKNAIYGAAYSRTDVWYAGALTQIFTEKTEPRLVIVHDDKAHNPFLLDENGSEVGGRSKAEGLNPSHYPPHHRYAARVLTAYIDFILKNDPDAVIVVQADHGLHDAKTRAQLLAAGKTEDDVRVMQNSVISAVRIPERWGGLDKPIDPLNISRVLINRYVGEQYALLETHP
ncbi:MAG: hypothetical protein LBC77_00865 [Spirochaetaceae bacterium]|jgi:hypothetical protein|nr:hypothetical protein [Spirochaetaceae bacterium]